MSEVVNIFFTAFVVLIISGYATICGFKTMSSIIVRNMEINARLQKVELIDALLKTDNLDLHRAANYLLEHLDD